MYEKTPIIKSLRDFLFTCPHMDNGQVYIEGLGAPMECSVDPVKGEVVYRNYTDGRQLKQYLFALTSKDSYDEADRKKIADDGFCQFFQEWLEQQNNNEIYPVLDGYTTVRIETVQSGYLFAAETAPAKYQIQCRLIYTH